MCIIIIRVEYNKLSQQTSTTSHKFSHDDGNNMENINRSRICIFHLVESDAFFYIIHTAIVFDCLIQATTLDSVYSISHVTFTLLFDIELILKVVAFGAVQYMQRSTFEGLLCVGSTCFLPFVVAGYREYSFFMVLRLARLPMCVKSIKVCRPGLQNRFP